jgi:hypothetical protein
MKTIINTSVKGSENLTIEETQNDLWDELIDKNTFIRVTRIEHSGKKKKYTIKKSNIRLIKEQ